MVHRVLKTFLLQTSDISWFRRLDSTLCFYYKAQQCSLLTPRLLKRGHNYLCLALPHMINNRDIYGVPSALRHRYIKLCHPVNCRCPTPQINGLCRQITLLPTQLLTHWIIAQIIVSETHRLPLSNMLTSFAVA